MTLLVTEKPKEPYGNDFGPVIKEWFKRNQWPQILAEKVARSKGSAVGPWASQISNTMNCKIEPKPPFFGAMGWFNKVIFDEDYQGITDTYTKELLKGSVALCHDDGKPFTSTDFLALFLGEIQAPASYQQVINCTITPEVVKAYWENIREIFRELRMEMMMQPFEVWQELESLLKEQLIPSDDIHWFKECLVDRLPTVEESTRMRHKYPGMPVIQALTIMKEQCGGSLDRLGKCGDLYQQPTPANQLIPSECM